MKISAKMKIKCSAHDAYEAFADPSKIGNFWFSLSSCRWEGGKTITLNYEEYVADFDIYITKTVADREIEYRWGEGEDNRTCSILFIEQSGYTVVECIESGWKDNAETTELLKNQTGWVYMLTCLKAYLENGISTLRTGLLID